MKNICLFLLALGCAVSTSAQFSRPAINAPEKMIKNISGLKPKPLEGELIGFRNPPSDAQWNPVLNKVSENESEHDELLERIKKAKNAQKQAYHADPLGAKTTVAAPTVGTNFTGLDNAGLQTPLDNTVAISNAGVIVAFVNSTIGYFTSAGALTYSHDIYSMIGIPSLTNNLCDPKVIYDNVADRFIFYVQVCDNISANSKVVMGFSNSNDPSTGWWVYQYSGNPLGDGSWFDYPKVGISNDEVFVSGNLFYEGSNSFNQSIVYQIQKGPSYTGGSALAQYWSGITGAFTILPLSYGQSGSYGPGILLVSTDGATSGSTNINLYEITNNIASGTAVFNSYLVSTSTYSTPGNAQQSGTSQLLDIRDCRSQDGFYLHGKIHLVFQTDAGSGYSGIDYNRINIATGTNVSSNFAAVGSSDMAYPCVASIGADSNDAGVIIAFNQSNSSMFPRTCVVACDNAMVWSPLTVVKPGSGYVHLPFITGGTDRWGDYTGICRKYNDSPPAVWMAGMYGNSTHYWSQWIARIGLSGTTLPSGIDNITSGNENVPAVYPNPVEDIYYVRLDIPIRQNLVISIVDMQGKVVKELCNEMVEKGANRFSFNKSNLAAGAYTLLINGAEGYHKVEKLIIGG